MNKSVFILVILTLSIALIGSYFYFFTYSESNISIDTAPNIVDNINSIQSESSNLSESTHLLSYPEKAIYSTSDNSSLTKVSDIENVIDVKQIDSERLLVLTMEQNKDIPNLIDDYYKVVEEDFKKLYGDSYVLDRDSIEPPRIDSPCSEFVLGLSVINVKDSTINDISMTINLIASIPTFSITHLDSDDYLYFVGISCIGDNKFSNNEFDLVSLKLDLKNQNIEILQKIDSNVDGVISNVKGNQVTIRFKSLSKIDVAEKVFNFNTGIYENISTNTLPDQDQPYEYLTINEKQFTIIEQLPLL